MQLEVSPSTSSEQKQRPRREHRLASAAIDGPNAFVSLRAPRRTTLTPVIVAEVQASWSESHGQYCDFCLIFLISFFFPLVCCLSHHFIADVIVTAHPYLRGSIVGRDHYSTPR
ncbi:hypothetical protein H0G86_009483 [Trichoderma simmonsii]|uniref:Uncharacterized protein n=1 Tax=Trichoderma simmonsii TaxID=1491479 RepID=A0A8G0LJJ5_9HYPO|nr:hypothetical protein H0G86_009483 [Trichoderma simmonsii]